MSTMQSTTGTVRFTAAERRDLARRSETVHALLLTGHHAASDPAEASEILTTLYRFARPLCSGTYREKAEALAAWDALPEAFRSMVTQRAACYRPMRREDYTRINRDRITHYRAAVAGREPARITSLAAYRMSKAEQRYTV